MKETADHGVNSTAPGNRAFYCYYLVAIVLFVSSLVFLEMYGKAARVFGPVAGIDGRQPVKTVISSPVEAYKNWHEQGCRGRIVVSLSRFLNFMESDEIRQLPQSMNLPLHVYNLAQSSERHLTSKNFLNVAMKMGVVREVVHVVPEKVFAEKLQAAREERLAVSQESFSAPYKGSPRTIATATYLSKIREPVLVYVDASFFTDYEPSQLLQLLKAAGLRTDMVQLCMSTDDGEVTAVERDRLRSFGKLIGAIHGSE